MSYRFAYIFIFGLLPIFAFTQSEGNKVRVKNADSFVFENLDDGGSIQRLRGNVKMEHDSSFMYADSAIIRETLLTAIGNISIIQNDTTIIFSDSLIYDSDSHEAQMFENVVLENGIDRLFTEQLNYNTKTKIAIYRDTAILSSPRTSLTSVYGRYDLNAKMVRFQDQVVIIDSSFTLYTDSLDFNTSIRKADFIGPSYIYNNNREIYCEDGFYLIDEGKAYFTKNAYLLEEDKIAKGYEISYNENDSLLVLTGNATYNSDKEFASADVISFDDLNDLLILSGNAYYEKDSSVISGPLIIVNTKNESLLLEERSQLLEEGKILTTNFLEYDDQTGRGYASGEVEWKDTIENSTLYCQHLIYEKEREYFQSYGDSINPVLINEEEGDSMFLSADTLLKYNEVLIDSLGNADTLETFIANYNVGIWKSDFSAIADSLFYSSKDSTYRLYGQPILWTDSTEYKADTIFIKMAGTEINQMNAVNNAMIVYKQSDKYYDQIKGKQIISYFDSSEIKTMDVLGSAESIYFIKDEEESLIGPNHTRCSRISFFFNNEDMDDVKYYQEPESVLTPIQQAGREELFLSGFNWYYDQKPVDWNAIRQLKRAKLSISRSSEQETVSDSLNIEAVNDPFKEEVEEIMSNQKNQK